MPRVGVILVTYENERDIGRCVASLAKTDWPYETDVCLVDNGSKDATLARALEAAAANGLPLLTHANGDNQGFAPAVNAAYRLLASRRDYDYWALLNPDTETHPQWLSALTRTLEEDADAGSAGARLMLPDGTANALGCRQHYLGFGYMDGYRADRWPTGRFATNYVSGAAVLIRDAALKDVQRQTGDKGIFWNDLFLYHEDLDLGWQLRMAGWKNVIESDSVVVHYHSFDGGSRNAKKFHYQERNRYMTLAQNYHWGTLLLVAPLVVAVEIGMWFLSLRPTGTISRVKLWADVARQFARPELWARRRRIQAARTVSDMELWGDLAATITHQEIDKWWVRAIANPLMKFFHSLYGFVIWW